MSLVASLIMTGIAAASSAGQGIAGNISAKRAAEAQERVDAERAKFEEESQQMQMDRAGRNLAFQKSMASQQNKRDILALETREKDLKEGQKRQEASIGESILSAPREAGASRVGRAQKNILNLQGRQ